MGRWELFSGPQQRLVVAKAVIDMAGSMGGGPDGAFDAVGANIYLGAWDGSFQHMIAAKVSNVGPIRWEPDGLAFAFIASDVNMHTALYVYSYDGKLLWNSAQMTDPAHYLDMDPLSVAWTTCN
jgi:hypothetical protein